jgi:hypothetical protein
VLHGTIKKGQRFPYGDLAEVVGLKISQYGYKSFTVKYLDKPPIPSIPIDSFASQYVTLLFKRKKLARQVRDLIKRQIPNSKISHVKMAQAIRKSAIEAWQKMGLNEHYHEQKELSEQKLQEVIRIKQGQFMQTTKSGKS